MKNIFKLKKFKKTIIVFSAISFGLSIGLTAGLVSDQSKHLETAETYVNSNQDLLGLQTKQSFEETKITIKKNEDLKSDFKSQLNFYQSNSFEFSLDNSEHNNKNNTNLKMLKLKNTSIKNNELISNQEVNNYVSKKIAEYESAYLKGEFSIDVVLDNANKAGWSNEKIINEINNYKDSNYSKDISENLNSKNQSYELSLKYSNYGKTFGEGINKIDNLLKGMAVTSAVAWVAAGGFWAAAWWFGISIPWAVAATSLAVGLTANTIGISLLKSKMKAPIEKGFTSYSTSIANKELLVKTSNKSIFDYISDFVSCIEAISNFISDFKFVRNIISTLCSASSFAVPSSSLVQKLMNIVSKYILESIFSTFGFKAFRDFIVSSKETFYKKNNL